MQVDPLSSKTKLFPKSPVTSLPESSPPSTASYSMNSSAWRAMVRIAPSRGLCASCRLHLRRRQQQQQQRFASSSTSPPKPPAAGIAALPSRQLLSVSGAEATKFLQGMVTANMASADGLPRTDPFYSGFLNATGRVVHDIFIYPFRQGSGLPVEEDGYLIEADADQMARFAKLIKRYKLRAKVNVRQLTPDEATVWQAWDDASSNGLDLDLPNSKSRLTTLRDPRAPGLGHRIIQIGQSAPDVNLDMSTQDAYTVRRYLHGVAEGQDEILREQALPLESNMEMMNGIDFHKGCYVGQELTIRTKHRGVVRKRILPCIIYGRDKAPPQNLTYELEQESPESLSADMIPTETSIGRDGKRGRSAGKWLKGVGDIGLGLCRLEIMTDVVLPGEQAAATFKPGDEFVLEWGDEDAKAGVKVKAFVPEWLRSGLAGQ